MDLAAKIEVLKEFLSCAGVAYWHFDGEMTLLSTSAGESDALRQLLTIGGCKQILHQYCLMHQVPGFCSDAAALLWLASPRYVNGVLTDVHVIGPVFGSETSEQSLMKSLQGLNVPQELAYKTAVLLRQVPVIPHTLLMQYGLLLHWCLTGEKLEKADLQIVLPNVPSVMNVSAGRVIPSRSGAYALEQQIFQAVEEGDINYTHPKDIYSRGTGSLCRGDPLRHAKNELVSCLTLVTRAAIRGGLPEDTAYALSDWYIQMGEASGNVAEVYQYSQDAFKDFTERVHKCKLAQGRSKEIQECISYLEVHIRQRVTLEELAKNLGYNKNYLSTKFRREVGIPVSEYAVKLKIERAKLWLLNSDKSMQEISDELGFNSLSYFSAQFRKIVGRSPTEFRNRVE